MFKAARIMFLYTESSVHPGAGDSTGVVDLPIQREIHTNFPIIQGSELKGALREYFENKYAPNNAQARFKIKQVFGPSVNSGVAESGGALGFSMSRVILFPIASLKGIFAYVTCPMCLETFRLDLREVNNTSPCYSGLDQIPEITDEKTALIPKGAEDVITGGKVILSEFPFSKIESDKLNTIAKWLSERFPTGYEYFKDKLYKEEENGKIHSNLVVIRDDIFKDLLRIKTEVVHRNQLENGISQNLWTEENLPSDTLLYSMLYAAEPYKKKFKSDENSEEQSGLQSADDVAGYFENEDLSLFILGGNQTVGRGWIRTTFYLKEDIS